MIKARFTLPVTMECQIFPGGGNPETSDFYEACIAMVSYADIVDYGTDDIDIDWDFLGYYEEDYDG